MRNTTTRNAEAAAALRAGGADVVELDVTADASVDAAAAKILATGTPDLLATTPALFASRNCRLACGRCERLFQPTRARTRSMPLADLLPKAAAATV